MTPSLLDNPLVLSSVFYPRTDTPAEKPPPNVYDGTILVAKDIAVGYRFYVHTPQSPLLLFFHGNGEIASDYDDLAPLYHEVGVSLLVVDYRGYGWSTGKPLVSTLSSDAEPVVQALPDVLKRAGVGSVPWFVKGRSLGSAPAIHAAYKFPERFKGLIVESGFADMPSALFRIGLTAAQLVGIDEPIANARKIRAIHLPLLIIHGERDIVLPVESGQKLYDISPSEHKMLLRIPGAGHNDLLLVAMDRYFGALRMFIQ